MGSVPTLDLSSPAALRASAILTGAYVYSSIIDVTQYRSVTMFLTVTCASAANEVTLVPVGSPNDTAPAAGDDSWFAWPATDGSVTGADLTQTVATGADYTTQPNWGRITVYPMEIRLKAATNATDKIRVKIKLDTSDIKWMQVACADADGAGTLSTVKIDYVGVV